MLNTMLAVSAPTGLWADIINWISGGVANYAVVIILMTLIIKAVMLPLDFLNRYVTTRGSKQMAAIQPKIEAVNKKFANNPQKRNEETLKLYKSAGYNPIITVGMSIIYLVASSVIFLTLWGSLRDMSSYKIWQEYDILQDTYVTTYNNYADENGLQQYELNRALDTEDNSDGFELDEGAKAAAEEAVRAKYAQIKQSFLWIKNVWGKDNSEAVVLSYSSFMGETHQSTNPEDETYISEQTYKDIMTNSVGVNYQGQWNGYYILPVLAALISWLSTRVSAFVGMLRAKRKGQPYVDPMSQHKIMAFIMPVILAIFTILYTSIFAIYVVIGAIFNMLTAPFMTLLVEWLASKTSKKKQPKKPIYSR